MEVKLFYMIGGKPVTGGQIYEYLFVNVLKSIPSIRVKIQTNEKWARGIRKVVAPIVNVRILNKVRNDDVLHTLFYSLITGLRAILESNK